MSEFKVFIPLDGTRMAEHSLLYLKALQAFGDVSVLLVSVVDPSARAPGLNEAEVAEREANVLNAYLNETAAEIRRQFEMTVITRIKRGVPGSVVLEEAEAFAPDLLVIATHGHQGLSRWRAGGVADQVARRAGFNTLIVGPKAAEMGRWLATDRLPAFDSVLVPLDGSDFAERALPVAEQLASRPGTILNLVQVVPAPVAGIVSIPVEVGRSRGDTAYVPGKLEDLVEVTNDYLTKTAAGLDKAAATNKDVLVGPTAESLLQYVSEKRIDVVVMTSHGRGGFVRAALGSVTDRLVGSNAPVLVVR